MKFILLILTFLAFSVAHAEDENVEIVPKPPVVEEEISPLAHVGGPLLSYIVGFGSGHGVQGTWTERGQKFTIMDSVGFGLIFYGALESIGGCVESNSSCKNGSGVLWLGVGTLVVSRIWAIADTIIYPFEHNRKIREIKSTTDFYIDPTKNQAGVIYRF